MHGQIHFDCYQDLILNISNFSLNNVPCNLKNPSKVSVIIFFPTRPCQWIVPLDLAILICTSKTGPTLKDDVLRLMYWASVCIFNDLWDKLFVSSDELVIHKTDGITVFYLLCLLFSIEKIKFFTLFNFLFSPFCPLPTVGHIPPHQDQQGKVAMVYMLYQIMPFTWWQLSPKVNFGICVQYILTFKLGIPQYRTAHARI